MENTVPECHPRHYAETEYSRLYGGDERVGLLLSGPELLGHLSGAADHGHDHLAGVGLAVRVLRVAHQVGQPLDQPLVVQPLTEAGE